VGEHAEVAPSSLDFLAECPGYRPSGESSAAADRGTDFHAIMASVVKGESVNVPDELAELVAFAEQAYRRIFDGFGDGAGDFDVFVEERLYTELHGIWGTTDVALVDTFESRGAIIDWKSGRGNRKSAAQSLQVAAYACGASKRWDLESVDCYIVEPDKKQVSKVTLARADLDAAILRMRDIIKARREDDPLTYQSGAYCRYCRRSVTCPAVVSGSLVPVERATLPDAAAMQPSEIAAFLDRFADRIELADQILGQVKARAHAILEAGGEVDGWRLVPGRKVRKWANEAAAAERCEEWAREQAGRPLEDLYETSLLSPAQMEKLDKSLKPIVAGLVEVKQSPKLVRDEEKKEIAA